MYTAHLVFADIDGQSDMPLERRAWTIAAFWQTCYHHKPRFTGDSSLSFYDIDNDSLMAGFSGVNRMSEAHEVLLWTLDLHRSLSALGVPVLFGVGLAAARDEIDWEALPGFLPQLRTHLYFPDDQELLDGRVDRRRLIGDPLILAARLLSLAKKTKVGIAFAFLPGDRSYEHVEDVQARLQVAGVSPAFSLKGAMRSLPRAHREWAKRWNIEPYGFFRDTSQVSRVLVEQLSDLGAVGRAEVPPILQNRDEAWRLLMCGNEPWRRLGADLSDDDLRRVIMGLVLYSRASGWNGGSRSPVLVLYHEFLRREPQDEPQVTSWIVANRRNGYEPFGTLGHGGARTQSEYLARTQRWVAERAERHASDLARQEEGRAAKLAAATRRLAPAVRRGDVKAVQALLDRGADWQRALPAGQSLLQLAHDHGREKVATFLVERGIK